MAGNGSNIEECAVILRPEPITIVVPTLAPGPAEVAVQRNVACAGCSTIVDIVHDTKGEGFTRTVNRGLRRANTDYVCILNDDVESYTDDWLAKLRDVIHGMPGLIAAGPSGPCKTTPQNTGIPGAPYGVIPVSHLAFFCVVLKMHVLEEVGFLDEDFTHGGSDVFMCWAARKLGYVPVWARHIYVAHTVHEHRADWHRADQQTLKRKLIELNRRDNT